MISVTEGPAQWLSPSLLAPKGLLVSGHYNRQPQQALGLLY